MHSRSGSLSSKTIGDQHRSVKPFAAPGPLFDPAAFRVIFVGAAEYLEKLERQQGLKTEPCATIPNLANASSSAVVQKLWDYYNSLRNHSLCYE